MKRLLVLAALLAAGCAAPVGDNSALEGRIAELETRLEELGQEDAIWMRRGARSEE